MAGQQPQGNPPPPPPLLPDSTNEDGMVDTNWFKVVITKCPTGGHDGTASVSLDRRHGLWTVLPDSFFHSALVATSQVPIKELILKNHRLNTLPLIDNECPVAESLVLLDISSNLFEVLCDQISFLHQLKHINATGNHITFIPMEITKLTHLQTLHLQKNKLEAFPQSLCNLRSLKHLNLECNSIQEIPEDIALLQNLRELYMKSNKLQNLPTTINQLFRLEVLHVADNSLESLPTNMCFTQLKQLHLAQNRLKELPVSLGTCTSLQGLTVNSNPLLFPPPSVYRRGVDAIIKFLRESGDGNLAEECTPYSSTEIVV